MKLLHEGWLQKGSKGSKKEVVFRHLFPLFCGQMPEKEDLSIILTFLRGPSFIRSGKFLLNPNG